MYQVRHKELGVYQGSFMGMGFWHPTSDMPEQGYGEFPTYKQAKEYIDFLCSNGCSVPLKAEDLNIEPYDKDKSEAMESQTEIRTILPLIKGTPDTILAGYSEPGWYFWDKSWYHLHGPFSSKEEAETVFAYYTQ
jgi:hypothetical protein